MYSVWMQSELVSVILDFADNCYPAAMGGTYEFVKTASANLREKEDHWNVALGGFFSGTILGLRGLCSYPLSIGNYITLF